jgi:hypothetical protein
MTHDSSCIEEPNIINSLSFYVLPEDGSRTNSRNILVLINCDKRKTIVPIKLSPFI